ncbi:hypothetical protein LPTSP4_21080 [Leptospira ryugenii]|uniref:Lipase modulator n=1 Tax=Leptospira ryugenii TaxID=1917863 RepID=A0A2P2E139_9LEPT|nr:hypothetical protein [Leptospira ryugenii]GBF50582.1 hypothetical protein LPTSP4_21080 [Leptospira ryugenii]
MFQSKKRIYIILVLAACIFLGLYYSLRNKDKTEERFRELSKKQRIYEKRDLGDLPENYDQFSFSEFSDEQIAKILQEKYGKNIDNPRVQFALLEELMKELPKLYPDRWVEKLNEILQLAFPEKAMELFRLSEKMYSYNVFREKNMIRLGMMSEADRRKEVWKERYRLFGEKADEIWAIEKKMQNVSDALQRIQESPPGNIDAKLSSFKSTLKENFGKELPQVLAKRQQTLTEGFVQSVQKDLKIMSFAERKSTLRDIREAMGMDQAALNRWDALEDEREQKWKNLETYRNLRSKLLGGKTTLSPEKEKELEGLRTKLFGEEAEIIRNEEASGYYRTLEERTFGIN